MLSPIRKNVKMSSPSKIVVWLAESLQATYLFFREFFHIASEWWEVFHPLVLAELVKKSGEVYILGTSIFDVVKLSKTVF